MRQVVEPRNVRRYDRLYLGGAWVEPLGDAFIEVIDPHDRSLVGVVPHASNADVDAAVAAARTAFDNGPWPRMSLAERSAVIERIRDGIVARLDEIATLITAQNGSPIGFSQRGQVMAAVAVYSTSLATAAAYSWEEERPGMAGPVLVRKEPLGVVAAITPWNVPQFAIAAKLAPALLAGCSVIVKPSPEAPLDAFVLAEICAEAGLPDGVVSVLPADREVSAYLVAHPGVDKVAFTGSVGGGSAVMTAAAANLTRVTLELGGKSAGIVLEDADLDLALPAIVGGAFLNNGQACVALSRILVPESRAAEIEERLVEAVSALAVGDPRDPSTQVGPLVSEAQWRRVRDYVALGVAEGARVLVGGGTPPGLESGWYVEPTVLADVRNDMRVAREEIFGPVTCLITYRDEAEAVALANDSDFGLAGTVFGSDLKRGIEVARRVRSGTLAVNCQRFDLAAPFGGYKRSGIGREFGPEGLGAYVETKSIALPPLS